MVQFIQRSPSFGEELAKGIGGGLTKGIDFALQLGLKKQAQQAKNASKIRPGIKSFLSLYDKNKAFDSDMISNLENLSHKYLEKGLSPDEAISSAYNEILQSAPETPKEQSPWKGDPDFLKKLGIVSDEGLWEDIKTGAKKGVRSLVQLADFPLQLARRSNYRGRGSDFKTLTDYYDELTEGKGVPTNAVERIAQGIPLGFPGVAAEYAGETLRSANLPESVQEAGQIITFLAAHRVKIPELKNVIGDAKKVAEKTGQNTEQVLQKATQESGANLEKVAQGDAEELSKLRSRLGAEKVEQTPKEFFNKKAAEKQRATFGAKLPESPLSEYYDIRAREAGKEASKRPETLAREKEIRSKLAPEENRLYGELRSQRDQLASIEKELKKSSPENSTRLEALKEFQSRKVNETLENLKNVQYEMKYGRPRPSEAEIDAQIQKSINEFKEGIANPTEASEKALQRQLELDQKYLDRASKLADRGELPGEIRPDTFLKMKQKYLEGYKEAIQKARAEISELKGETDFASKKRIADNQALIKKLSERIKRLEADIINQTDNIKAMRALEKPSGAFYKQQIKSLQKDAALFKDDLFKQKRIKSPQELKTQKVFSDSPKVKMGREAIENPSQEKIKSDAKEAGKSESEFTEALKQVRKEANELKSATKSGDATPNVESKFLKRAKNYIKYLGTGYALGATQASLEEAFGTKINATTLKALARIFSVLSIGTTTLGHSHARSFFDGLQAQHLSELRGNPREWNTYIDKIRKKHGSAKVKRILKIVNQQ